MLVLDEIDSVIGDTLIAVLRQLRSGYTQRPAHFPQSVILCGVRDIRDYRIHSSRYKEVITGGSAFNIKAESLRLGDFNKSEVEVLINQHTQETGQIFTGEAKDCLWHLSQGQPWLVNALAYETCFKMKPGRDRSKTIDKDMVDQAKENLIARRETHLDQLADKLQEERVRRIIEPLIELKILYKSLEATLAEGLEQTRSYMDLCGTQEGHLVIFDRRDKVPWEQKIFQRRECYQRTDIVVWGM
ncbi:MAG: hypothetical protein K9J81_04595 [Desulfohalobiaceae bacterium]|nr:hypothetical protein [Desulfohalobiaceae bacterium]